MLFQSDLDPSFLKFRGNLFSKLTHYDPVAIAPGTDFVIIVASRRCESLKAYARTNFSA
jgi:hypothetical protein